MHLVFVGAGILMKPERFSRGALEVPLCLGSSDLGCVWRSDGGAWRGTARLVSGPGYNNFCGRTGVGLEPRRHGHARW